MKPVHQALRNREGIACRAAAGQPAGDRLRRNAGNGGHARHVEPVVAAGQFGQAEEPARRDGPAGADGSGQRPGMCREVGAAGRGVADDCLLLPVAAVMQF